MINCESLERRVSALESLILERKQVGTLYHVCSLPSFIYNIENNKLEAGKDSNRITYVDGSPVFFKRVGHGGKRVYYWIGKRPDNYQDPEYQERIKELIKNKGVEKTFISFTRNKRYIAQTRNAKYASFIRIVLDGDSISDSKSVRPYDIYDGDYYDPYTDAQSDRVRSRRQEAEELVESPLLNLDKYIIRVEIDPSVRYAKESPDLYGFTSKTLLNKFVKVCKQHNIKIDTESKQRLIDAYVSVFEYYTGLKINNKVLQSLKDL